MALRQFPLGAGSWTQQPTALSDSCLAAGLPSGCMWGLDQIGTTYYQG